MDLKPSTWLDAGFDVDTVNHLIKLNTNDAASNKLLAQLTDSQADPTTGDIRRVAFAIAEALYLAWKNQPTNNQPKKMVIGRSVVNNRDGTVQNVYTLRFTVTPPGGDYSIPAES
jgi:hypothetical protein